MALPLLCLLPSGTSKMRIQKQRPLGREDQQPVVVGCREDALQKVLFGVVLPLGSHASAPWARYSAKPRTLDVPGVADGHDHLLVGNHVLNAEVGAAVFDGGTTLVTENAL